jgi:hypothetical protein
MPMVVPIIIAAAEIYGGSVALGAAVGTMATIAAGAAIAGGAVTLIGAATGNSHLEQYGSYLGAAGSVATGAIDLFGPSNLGGVAPTAGVADTVGTTGGGGATAAATVVDSSDPASYLNASSSAVAPQDAAAVQPIPASAGAPGEGQGMMSQGAAANADTTPGGPPASNTVTSTPTTPGANVPPVREAADEAGGSTPLGTTGLSSADEAANNGTGLGDQVGKWFGSLKPETQAALVKVGAQGVGGLMSYIAPSPEQKAEIAASQVPLESLQYTEAQRAAYNNTLLGASGLANQAAAGGANGAPVAPATGILAQAAQQQTPQAYSGQPQNAPRNSSVV